MGTYAAPTATKCRFKEVDATNHPGVYELQIADARFAVSSAKSLLVSINGATNLAQCDVLVPLRSVNPYDGVRFGQTALPNAAAGAAGGLWILGANAAANTTLTGTAASGGTPATPALTLTGGAASTTSGGTSAEALKTLGGAGAASTNGAAAGATFTAGGTTTVSGSDGLQATGTGNGNGLSGTGVGTGSGILSTGGSSAYGMKCTGASGGLQLIASSAGHGLNCQGASAGDGIIATGGTSGHGIESIGGSSSGDGIRTRTTGGNANGINAIGTGSGDGLAATGGATGRGIHATGGGTSGAGIRAEATAGNSNGVEWVHQGSGQDVLATLVAANFGAASLNGKGDWLLASSYTTPPTTAQIATGVWTDTTASDFTTALSVGKSLMNGVSLGTGLTVAAVSGAVGSVTAAVTVGTNNDKTGYSLSQTFPTNFSALAITAGGAVTAGTVSDKTGYSLVSTGLDAVLVAGKTLPAAVRYIGAVLAGTISGAGSGTEVFKDFGGTTAVTVTCDTSGNRTAVVLA